MLDRHLLNRIPPRASGTQVTRCRIASIGRESRNGPSSRCWIDEEQGLSVFDGFRAFRQHLYDAAVDFGLNLVHQFHGLHDAQHLPLFHEIALIHVRIGVGRRRAVEGADNRRGDGHEVGRVLHLLAPLGLHG